MNPKSHAKNEMDISELDGVTLIYLSFNGANYLKAKINFLLKELSVFKQFELIVIDDNSKDGSREILEKFRDIEHLRLIIKDEQKGVPHSMNIGVEMSNFEHIVFCDQRQRLSPNIIKQLVNPLRYMNTGAVSSCISSLDQKKNISLMRKHENFIKSQEGKSGNLIGVYGPLYAIKKKCYSRIPDYIILDDLYLTLKILESNQVLFIKNCQVFDEDCNVLYSFSRIKRYLKGLLQLLTERNLIRSLKKRQIVMLIWHKYFRLFIPLILFIFYICLIINCFDNRAYIFFVILFTALLIISGFQKILKLKSTLINLLRINLLYLLSFLQITVSVIFTNNSNGRIYSNKL
jgi:glycosyltransferase involved in cell wall biosynthesis